MAGTMERSTLWVEGRNDLFALVNLLIRHGVDYDTKPWPSEYPKFQEAGGAELLLEGMTTAIRLSGERAVGFVLDADSPLLDRWHAVRDRLESVDVDAPRQPSVTGFIGQSAEYLCKVGVWLMPDNQHDGKLESLLKTLIKEEDPLIDHATTATDTAKRLGAQFIELDRIKAVLHAWLAWQEEPGRPYGTAIRAKFFRHDSAAAHSFVDWFKRLFQIA